MGVQAPWELVAKLGIKSGALAVFIGTSYLVLSLKLAFVILITIINSNVFIVDMFKG